MAAHNMETPPQLTQTETVPSSSSAPTEPLERRASKRLSTARRSLLGLFAQMTGEHSIPEDQEAGGETPAHIDATPPRLASLDFPRHEISLAQPPSPTSVRSVPRPVAPPVQTQSARSSLQRHPQEEMPVQAPTPAHVHRSMSNTYNNIAGEESPPNRHPADLLPDRHPADAMLARSISEGSEGSGTSNTSRWRKRRRRRRNARALPETSLRRKLFPALRYPSVRRKVLHALISGVLMILVLAVFLALMNTSSVFISEFRIIVVLFMLVFVVLFAHSMIRLIVLLLRLRRNGGLADPDLDDPESYAQVQEPIRVVLARDEEIGISGNPAPESNGQVAPLPPAYGRWRGSVRVDPNLIHWERVQTNERPLSSGTTRRPPSYISEKDDEDAEVNVNIDQLSEKPIRPRTPPIVQQQPPARATVIYDARENWVPQMPRTPGPRSHLSGMISGWRQSHSQ